MTPPHSPVPDWAEPSAAHTIEAIRFCPHLSWSSRSHSFHMTYTAMLETPGPTAVAALIAIARREGHITEVSSLADRARSLYVCAADSAVIAGYAIPSEESWQWWVTTAQLRLADIDCPTCTPTVNERSTR